MRKTSLLIVSVAALLLHLPLTTHARADRSHAPTPREQTAHRMLHRREQRTNRRLLLRNDRRIATAHTTENIPPSPGMEEEVLRLVNRERTERGLTTLTLHPLLRASARHYAATMAKGNFFSHTDPDGGRSIDRIRATGYLQPPCVCAWEYATGENLARNQRTPAAVVDAWMASPTHRANVLHPQFHDMGLGYDRGYWVQHFGGIGER
jgi:uncharacterized protein YkwD